MKLTPTLVERTLLQFKAVALPDDHAARPRLTEVFGDHTFLVDNEGLHIVEALPTDTGKTVGQVVKLASWNDENKAKLTAHEPEPTNVVVALDDAA